MNRRSGAGPSGGNPDTGPASPAGPTRSEAVDGLSRELERSEEDAGIDRPRLEAERLLAHVLGIGRSELARTSSERLSPEQAGRLARVARRRMGGEPLQHIEGTVAFRDLVLLADRRALIPRPETEQLVDRVRRWAEGRGSGGSTVRVSGARDGGEPPLETALDIGTGSGAIALSLVHEGVARRVVALDVSEEALVQAAANRAAAGISDERVELRLASRPLWSSVGREERFDLVVSNPPYVREGELEELPAQIREHEPTVALAGGENGLEVIREIAEKVRAYLEPGGALFLEIGENQGEAVLELLREHGPWEELEVQRDLAGRDRFVRATRPPA